MAEERGSIAFFTTYRPPVALDIYSSPYDQPTSFYYDHISNRDELLMTDGKSYNYNGHAIPGTALKTILKHHPIMAPEVSEADVESGRVSALVFVSERANNLETLHIVLRFNDLELNHVINVFRFSDVFGTFDGICMEDSPCVVGDHLVYVSTKDNPEDSRQPWTVVYKTDFKTGKTDRLTPSFQADLSPSASPSGKQIAMASFQKRGGWNGERESLKTDIFVMNIEKPYQRKLVVKDGGWPTWGSDDVIFFHRKVGNNWGVFRAEISTGLISRVTPDNIDAITPAAIDATTVAVASINQKSKLSKFTDVRGEQQYRHIEIFDSNTQKVIKQITRNVRPKADHYNPFVIVDKGEKRIGYHRCRSHDLKSKDEVPNHFDKLQSPNPDVGLFRVSGVFPTFSKDGTKLAFVDNEFKNVWLADEQGSLRRVYQTEGSNKLFSTVWNQDPDKDILYVCMGPSFSAENEVDICAIPDASQGRQQIQRLTKVANNAFPSTNPEGTKLVFRSTRDGGVDKYKNLYIMEDAETGDFGTGNQIRRLTNGPWMDTHCKWSPQGDWIVFSSNRDRPKDAQTGAEDLDSGHYAVYLVKANDPSVVVRVIGSGMGSVGHVNHPFFSPDGKSIVVTSDLAAVSVDPISLPLFLHSARPYGDIFTVNIDPVNINKNKDLKIFYRITHSRYENATGTWTRFSSQDPNAAWNHLLKQPDAPTCPYLNHPNEGRRWTDYIFCFCLLVK